MKPVPPNASAFSLPVEPDVATPEPSGADDSGNASSPERPRRQNGVVVTYTLLAVNILFWLASVFLSGPASLPAWLGFSPGPDGTAVLLTIGAKINAAIQSGEYWRLIMPIFLHGGFFHLAGNSLMLLMLGVAVERIYGPARFFVLYLFSGICGNIASYEFSPKTGVGASGAIMGLAGVLIVFTIRHRHAISPRFHAEVRKILLPIIIIQLLIGFGWQSVDSMAHLGGLLGGCLLAALVETPLGGPVALARERLPVGIALATGLLLLGYTGISAAANVQRKLPVLRARGPERLAIAVEHYRESLQREPNQTATRLEFAEALAASGSWAEAAEQYQECLDRGEDVPGIRQRLADALLKSGQLTQAVNVLEQAVRREPGNWQLKAGLAMTLVEAHRAAEGAQLYEDILHQHPNEPVILNALAYTYADNLNTHLPQAIEMARRAVQLRPDEGAFWDTLAWAYYRNNQLEEAVTAQERAAKLTGTMPEIRYHLGVMYQAQGRRDAALQEYRAALRGDPKLEPARAALEKLEHAP
jgi:membrane associated rhomboid family serine protease/Flp pilus assembly protein TadD